MMPNMGDAGIMALSILRTCLRDWVGPNGPRRPRTLKTSASIQATGASLNHPYATAHRLVGKLIDTGFLVRVGDAIAVTRDPKWAPAIITYLEDAHDVMLRFVSELDAAGQLDHDLIVASRKPEMLAIISTAIDTFLVPFEMFASQIGDWTSKRIWAVLSALCTRHITIDPVLNQRYAYTSTPNSERRPVPSAVLCALSGTSTATGWRHCNAMAKAGFLTKDARGWMICTQELLEARMEAAVQGAVAFYRRRIEELMVKGLDPARLDYIHGRPPLVEYTPLP